MGRRKKLRDVEVLVVNQTFKLYMGYDMYVTLIFIKEHGDWILARKLYEESIEDTGISEHIARLLSDWYWGEYDYEVERSSEDFYCEYCGNYTNTKTIIHFNDDRLTDIKMYDDEHLGNSVGYSDEEVVEDWKKNNVTVTFMEAN